MSANKNLSQSAHSDDAHFGIDSRPRRRLLFAGAGAAASLLLPSIAVGLPQTTDSSWVWSGRVVDAAQGVPGLTVTLAVTLAVKATVKTTAKATANAAYSELVRTYTDADGRFLLMIDTQPSNLASLGAASLAPVSLAALQLGVYSPQSGAGGERPEALYVVRLSELCIRCSADGSLLRDDLGVWRASTSISLSER